MQMSRVYLLKKLLLPSSRSDKNETCKSGLLYSRLEGKTQDVKEAGRFLVLQADSHQYLMSLHEAVLTDLVYF